MAAAGVVFDREGAARILVVSSRADVRRKIVREMALATGPAAEADGGADALLKLRESSYSTLLLDREIEDLDVDELVERLRQTHPQLKIVLLDGGRREAESAAEAGTLPFFPAGASTTEAINLDGAQTPGSGEPRYSELVQGRSVRQSSLWEPDASGVGSRHDVVPAHSEPLPGMIGRSKKMQHLYRLARLVSPRDTAVLILGATGTGKELVARGIHELSRRSRGPFIVVNCAAIPESLLEAELFGFTRGAFTGAFQSRLGRIHAAHGGTLLLDEIGELPLSMQAKLLRFVQEGEVQRIGSADLFRVDARLIAATNADLLQKVAEKQFREDLYYRLAVFPLELPALRQRAEDVMPLARHFLEILCRRAKSSSKTFSPEAQAALASHTWPGNVRELQHSIERAFVLAEDRAKIRAEDLAMPTGNN